MAPLALLADAVAPEATAILTVAGLLFLGAAAAHALLRRLIRGSVAQVGRQSGLSTESAEFLGTLLGAAGPQAAQLVLDDTPRLLAGLAAHLQRTRTRASARRFAVRAQRLLDELQLAEPAFDGAPRPFDELALLDARESSERGFVAWVVAADLRTLTVVSPWGCPFPQRHALLVAPAAPGQPSFEAELLAGPDTLHRGWTLAHRLVDALTERRAVARVRCPLDVHTLPESGAAPRVRERLGRDVAVSLEELRATPAWAERAPARLVDLSPEGCQLQVARPVQLRDRLHLLLPDEAGTRVVALPLAEVVSLRRGEGGAVRIGCRFVEPRPRERLAIATWMADRADSRHAAAARSGVGAVTGSGAATDDDSAG